MQAITPDLVTELPTITESRISPDGRLVAFVVSDVDGEGPSVRGRSRIHLAPADGPPGEARLLTAGPLDGAPAWSPDGARLAFVRRPGTNVGAGERERAQAWVIDVDGGEARRASDLRGGVAALEWMPDGRSLLCTSRVDPDAPPETEPRDDADRAPRVRVLTGRIRYRGDGDGWLGDARAQIVAVEVASGEARALTSGPHNHTRPVPSPDGRRIAFVSSDRSRRRHLREPMGQELCVMPSRGGRIERLVPEGWSLGPLAWSPDGGEIAFIGTDRPTGQAYVYAVRVRDRRVRRLTSDRVAPHYGARGAELRWVGGRVLFGADERGAAGIYAVTTGTRPRLTPIHARQETHVSLSLSADGSRAAYTQDETARPPESVTLALLGGRPRRVSAVSRGWLAAHAVAGAERFRVVRAGVPIEGWLMHPPAIDRARRAPLVLSVHGGPHAAFGPGFTPVHQVLAGAGYRVLYVNPRGSSSYGADFVAAVNGDWGGEDYLDLMAALDAAIERPGVDPRRLGVYGYSYGGYMSAWIVGQTSRFAAAVVGAPVTDIANSFLLDDIGVALADVEWGGTPFERREWYVERSPITHVQRVRTPVLLLHGEDDHRCPIADSEAYYTALRVLGRTVEFVRFPGSSHAFARTGHPALRREYLARVVDWFDRWLGPRARRGGAVNRRASRT